MSGPQRFGPVCTGWDAQNGGRADLALREDGPAVLFADVEAGLHDKERLDWVMPIVDGTDDHVATRRTLALARCLMRGLSGRELIDAARQACPE